MDVPWRHVARHRYAAEIGGHPVDVAYHNAGAVRADLPAGAVRKEHVLKMLPFLDDVVVADISGTTLRSIIKRSVGIADGDASVHPEDGRFLSCFHRADLPKTGRGDAAADSVEMSRGGAAAAAWIFRGDERHAAGTARARALPGPTGATRRSSTGSPSAASGSATMRRTPSRPSAGLPRAATASRPWNLWPWAPIRTRLSLCAFAARTFLR